jgi:hypothetical protein
MEDATAGCKSVSEERTQYAGEDELSRRGRFWGLVGAIWLQATVLVFVAVQLSRLKTPMVDWLDKTIDLLVR